MQQSSTQTDKLFYIDICCFITNFYCKIRSHDLTEPILGVSGHAMANTCFTKYEVPIFNRPEDINRFQILQKCHMTQATPISR